MKVLAPSFKVEVTLLNTERVKIMSKNFWGLSPPPLCTPIRLGEISVEDKNLGNL